jgi:hypothetical protein
MARLRQFARPPSRPPEPPRPRDILDAMTSPEWWGSWFGGEDWRPWRVFVAAAFGLPIDDADDLAFYREHTARPEPPAERAHEAWAIIGRRGGKTRVMAFISMYLGAFVDWSPNLVPGERAEILLLAKDRVQAANAYRYLRAFFTHALLAKLITDESADTLTLRSRVVIRVATASFRSIRGGTVAAALADELAFWFDGEASANPAEEILGALRPAMLTMPGSPLMVASSPYAKRGPLYEAHRRYWGEPGRRLIWHAPTLAMHPSIVDDPGAVSQMSEERADDPAKAAAEYDAVFRDDVANFLDRDKLEALVVRGLSVREPMPGVDYVAFVDAAAGGADSYAAAVGHLGDDGGIHIDCLLEHPAGSSPDAATAAIVEALRTYRVVAVTGDNFAKLWTQDAFTTRGVAYDRCPAPRSDVYLEAAASYANGRVRLLDHPRSINQLAGLERRVHRGGRDSVGHAPGQHDDLANVICGIVYLLASASVPSLWRNSDLLVGDGAPHPWPTTGVRLIYASCCADLGGLATYYWAVRIPASDEAPAPVLLIDFDVGQPMSPTLFGSIRDRLNAFAADAHAPAGPLYTTAALAAQARVACEGDVLLALDRNDFAAARRAELVADPVGEALVRDRDAMALAAAQAIGAGRVKVCTPAHSKSLRSPLPVFAFRQDAVPDATTSAAMIGLVAGGVDARALPRAAAPMHAATGKGAGQSSAR